MTHDVEMCMVPKCSKIRFPIFKRKEFLRFRWSNAIPVPGNTALLGVPMLKWNHCVQVTNESALWLKWVCALKLLCDGEWLCKIQRWNEASCFLSLFPWNLWKASHTQRKRVPQKHGEIAGIATCCWLWKRCPGIASAAGAWGEQSREFRSTYR